MLGRPPSREGSPLEERECPQDLEAMSHDELLEECVRLCLRLNAEQHLMVREILRRGLMPGRPLPDSYGKILCGSVSRWHGSERPCGVIAS